jgi:tRNA G26 N,N-dimethylase Trm1
MSKQATKTNNDLSLIENKIKMRVMSLPDKDTITVLECFGGEGVLWKEVAKRTNKTLNILSIDVKDYSKKINLKGDNLKFIKNFDLYNYDIIDLDSYGSPSNQLEILKQKEYKGIVHCTFIQTIMGIVNKNILETYGYSKQMIDKCPTLFNKNGVDKLIQFIAIKFNVSDITICSHNNKNYFYFEIK